MAQGGPIERQDIITDEAIMAPLVLSKNMEVAVESMQKIRDSAIQYSSAIGNTDSTKKLGDATVELTKEQEQLIKIQNQIATQVAKNNDEYRAYQEQLKKVNDELKNNRAASDDWVKQATAQNSSLVKLEDALNKNRVAYANLRTEQERHSKTGKDLLKVIQDQDKGVKEIRDSMGQAQAHVGAYREEIERLIPTLRRLSPETAETAENLVLLEEKATLFGSAFATGLGALAAVVATVTAAYEIGKFSVEQYFERSIEGADRANRISAIFSATIETLKDKFASLGEKIIDTFSNEKFQTGFLSSIIAIFPVISAIVFQLTKQTGLLDDVIAKYKLTKELAEVENELKKEENKLIIELAEQELRKNKDLFEAREKLNHSDEERLKFAYDARDAIKEEIKLKLQSNSLQLKAALDIQEISGHNYENEERINKVRAARLGILQEEFQGQRRLQAIIVQISREILDRKIAHDKELTDTMILDAETRVKADMREQKLILASSDATLEERLKAQRQYTADELRLVEVTASKEKAALESAAQSKIIALGKDAAETYKIKKEVTDREAALDRKATEDKNAINEKSKQEQAKIIIDNSAYFIALKKRIAEEDKSQDLANLEESFAAGKISLIKYETEKVKILRGGSDLDLAVLKEGYQNELDILEKYLVTTVDLTEENKKAILTLIAGLRKDIAHLNEVSNADEVTARKAVNKKLIELQNELLAATLEVGNNLYQAQQTQIEARLKQIDDQQTEELALAENVSHDKTELQEIEEKRKLDIEKKYQAKRDEEQKKLRKSQHDQAIFQRDLAAFSIAVTTAEAVVAALAPPPVGLGPIAGIPLGVIIGAIGLLQEVALFTKPIPAYAKGRTSGGAEYAMINEVGPELVLSGGKAKLYDTPGPMLTYLNPGDKVLTAEETQAVIEAGIINDTMAYPSIKRQQVNNQVVTVYDPRMIEAVEKNKVPDLVRQGVEIYKVQELRKKNKRLINSKIGRFDE